MVSNGASDGYLDKVDIYILYASESVNTSTASKWPISSSSSSFVYYYSYFRWMAANGQIVTALFVGKQKSLITARTKQISQHCSSPVQFCFEDERALICSTNANNVEYKMSYFHHVHNYVQR